MLLTLKVENFLSIGEEVLFSMAAGKIQQHKEMHTYSFRGKPNNLILKIAAIYGANSSGKSNLIKAIDTIKRIVLKGTKPEESIPIIPFKLNSKYQKKTTNFEIEFIKNDNIYAFGFKADIEKIHEEWLYNITTAKPKVIYERKYKEKEKYDYTFLKNKKISAEERNFISFLSKGTRKNQLFLTECFFHKTNNNFNSYPGINDTIEWFIKNLSVIFPDTSYNPLLLHLDNSEEFFSKFQELICSSDTGIDGIELKEVKFDTLVDLPEELKNEIKKTLKPKKGALLNINNAILISKNKNNEIIVKKLFAKHKIKNGNNGNNFEYFDLDLESDGTRRLFDLIPVLINEDKNTELVVFIDELNRSLHPKLTKWFLEVFIGQSFGKKVQLIFTTHEEYMLDLEFLRKDEIWFTEKDAHKETKLFSLAEFKDIRFDKRIRDDYLLGRFGGIPKI